jgi:beta-glucanase (GH16 family)
MKTKIKSIVLLISFFSISSLQAQNYSLIWEDNFDGTSLDSSKWNIEQRIGVWNTGANSEFQHYRKENVNVADDGNGNNCLVLTAKKENYNGYAYTSGKVTTKGKFAFKKGKLEASIKIPELANGLWPAFWTLGYAPKGWPDCGEIDILEMGHAKGIADAVQNKYIGSHLFWGPYPADYGNEFVTTEDLSTGYFKHTVIWDENNISLYFNDASSPYFTMGISGGDTEEFRNYQHYIILNMAVGGSVPGIFNATDITANFPANMYIDWVKLYQLEGSEDNSTNPAIYGDFGVYEDESAVDMRMDINYDLSAEISGATERIGETPYDGDNILSYNLVNATPFQLNLKAGLNRNMTEYDNGSIQFAIKTNSTSPIQIGIADADGNEQFITFSAESETDFLRDGSWQSVYVALSDIATGIDFTKINQMIIVKGTPSADDYISIDKVVYKETLPAQGYYGIFTDNPLITEGFVVDNVNNNMFVWNKTVTFNEFYPAYEGENVHSYKSSGAEIWFGFGYHSENLLNFKAYANGYLNISMRTKSTGEFYVGIDGNDKSGVINFKSGSDTYGFKRDGEWYHLNIPFTEFTNQGVDLATINHVFKTGGASIGDIAIDNIYYSEALPDIENSVICYANSITITPNNRTIDVNEVLTFKAAVLNQFGNKFDSKPSWSATGGEIDETGKFKSTVAGDFSVIAAQDNASATASVKVIPLTNIGELGEDDIHSQLNNSLNQLWVSNMKNECYITVFSASGSIIYAGKSNQAELSIDMTKQASGIYIVRVISADTLHTNKLIKQ